MMYVYVREREREEEEEVLLSVTHDTDGFFPQMHSHTPSHSAMCSN